MNNIKPVVPHAGVPCAARITRPVAEPASTTLPRPLQQKFASNSSPALPKRKDQASRQPRSSYSFCIQSTEDFAGVFHSPPKCGDDGRSRSGESTRRAGHLSAPPWAGAFLAQLTVGLAPAGNARRSGSMGFSYERRRSRIEAPAALTPSRPSPSSSYCGVPATGSGPVPAQTPARYSGSYGQPTGGGAAVALSASSPAHPVAESREAHRSTGAGEQIIRKFLFEGEKKGGEARTTVR